MKKFLFVLSSVALVNLFACNNKKQKEDENGGPCSYDEKIYAATLLRLDSMNEKYSDGVFIVDWGNAQPDTVRYSSSHFSQYLAADQIINDSIKPGKVYQYIEQNIKSGSCNPHILTLELKPFVKPH